MVLVISQYTWYRFYKRLGLFTAIFVFCKNGAKTMNQYLKTGQNTGKQWSKSHRHPTLYSIQYTLYGIVLSYNSEGYF